MASLAEFGTNLSEFYLFSVQEMFVLPIPWKFPVLANWLLHRCCWLLISGLVYPGHVSCCLEIRDSFPHVVQQKCPYFPADKRNLQIMILACVQFSVETHVCIWVLNQWAYICFYCSMVLFWDGQIIFSRVSYFKIYFLDSKVSYSHKSHKNHPNTMLCYITTGKG